MSSTEPFPPNHLPAHGVRSIEPVVRIQNGAPCADSRDVAAYFGRSHKNVLRDIRELHCSDDFRRLNFAPIKINDLSGETTSHVLMTKSALMFLAGGYNGAAAGLLKERYFNKFEAMEAELRARPAVDPMQMLNDPVALRGLLLSYGEKVVMLEGRVDQMQPKVDAYERLAEADGLIILTDLAKSLGVAPKKFFDWLRQHRWIYKRVGSTENIAYQDKIEAGYLDHILTPVIRADGSDKVATRARATPKGAARIAQLMNADDNRLPV